MEQPSDEFIKLVVILTKEDLQQSFEANIDNIPLDTKNIIETTRSDEQKQKNRYANKDIEGIKSAAKQLFKHYYSLDSDKVVTWLLFLMVKGDYPTIKEKAVQLFDRLLKKEGKDAIESMSQMVLDIVKAETINLLHTKLTDTFREHLISIIESLACYLVPKGLWSYLEVPLIAIYNIEKNHNNGSTLHQNTSALIEVLSQYDFEAAKQKIMVETIYFKSGMTEDEYRSKIPILLSTLTQQDALDGPVHEAAIKRTVKNLSGIYYRNNPAWMRELIPLIVDTLIEVLNRHCNEKGFKYKSTKGSIFNYLMDIANKETLDVFTDNHIESIVSHMYWWLSEVKDIELDEWTYRTLKTDREGNIYNSNSIEESNIIIPYQFTTTNKEEYVADSHFMGRFARLFQYQRAAEPIFKQFNILVNSQLWKQRYAALMYLSKSCTYLKQSIKLQFPDILKTILKLVDDENIRVRWASLQCLIQLSMHFELRSLMIKPREFHDIFVVVGRTIRDTNECIQNSCCLFIQSIDSSLTYKKDIIVDNIILDGLFSSFEILLQSPKLYLVESVLVPLMSLIDIVEKNFIPYYPRFIPILLSLLEKHHGTIETRLLRGRAIKAFSMCGRVMNNKKTFSKDLFKFMLFVGKNEGSFDLAIQVFTATDLFIQVVDKSFEIYLPMIMRMIINTLETTMQQQQQEEEGEEDRLTTSTKTILSTLISLNNIMGESYGLYEPLAPFIHRLVDPLCRLVASSNSTIREHSSECLPTLVKLSKLQYGDRSDKTLEIFGVIFDSMLDSMLASYTLNHFQYRFSARHSNALAQVINVMGKNVMTFDQVKSMLDAFCKSEQEISEIAEQVRNGNQDVIGNRDANSFLYSIHKSITEIYKTIGETIKQNGLLAAPLISCSNLLQRSSVNLHTYENDYVKENILFFIEQYLEYGSDEDQSVINTFPHIIPPMIECLTHSKYTVRQKASITLGTAAQIGKDRFSPWVVQVLQGLDTMISSTSYYDSIPSIGKILRYVPLPPEANVNVILPKWLYKLPIYQTKEVMPTNQNFCAIVRLYPNQCLGNEYQHVEQLYRIIDYGPKEEKELLLQTWSFIKESIQPNWHNISSEDTRENLKYYLNKQKFLFESLTPFL
ncbi:hypothetical protein DFA_00491 [Cavenderia fasciculata]|uniref:Uncharacterized protein n=1 Tax=Cavenderia fasciculata TaxID=261658 RepID=F4PS32_CACFS|nr:uncharacterized protein DFA_00491 [Cavenderia fasciculata]EGG20630.1 hypothetical protein DFA_00491 [Cavenderia fasciculata]|eukprot:XP_004358480.1 hypothetical protein DFA_00491 [Cavenderia fasciculata]